MGSGHILGALALVSLATPALAVNLLDNGDFELGADPATITEVVPNDTRGIPNGWTQVPGRDVIDILHDDYSQGPVGGGFGVLLDPQSGDYFLDMNGGAGAGGIYQDVGGLVAGRRYSLSLYTGKWAENAFGTLAYALIDPTAPLTPLSAGSFDSTGTSGWFLRTISAVAPTSGILRVQIETTAAFQGAPGLDNVSLTAAVPEPATWGLLLLGFGLTGMMMRRRHAFAAA